MTWRLRLDGITKRYGSTVANDAVSLDVAQGEIHALLGENGAGKSTLVKIIYGVTAPDAGTIEWDGEPVRIADPAAARRLGIGMVFQHFSLFETLTVAENIALGLGAGTKRRDLAARIREVGKTYGLAVDPGRHVHHLSVGERQRVEILRCLMQSPKLLILDEPTSVLTPQEATGLFAMLRRLAGEGCSILFISHKLEEIRALCDAATVLRAGRLVGTCVPSRQTAASLAEMMIGATPAGTNRTSRGAAGPRLVVDRLSVPSHGAFGVALKDISFEVRAGEILGIAGVAGNGQTELLAALSGERRVRKRETVWLGKERIGRRGPAQRRRLGLSFIPEERLGRGAVGSMTLAENALLTNTDSEAAIAGVIRRGLVRLLASRIITHFQVRAGGPQARADSLSGGNLQKYIVGREIEAGPRVLLAAHPTWGVDVGAATAIRQALIDLANSGAGVLVVSEDLDELLEISDRIAVLSGGALSPPMPVEHTTREAIGLLMGGGATQAEAHPIAA